MKYIEEIILVNLLIHIIFIFITSYLFSQKINIFLLIISALLDIVYLIMYLLIPYALEPYRYLFILIISILPFINRGIAKAILEAIIYWMLNITLGGTSGIIYKLNTNPYLVYLAITLIFGIFNVYFAYKRLHYRNTHFEYQIRIIDNNKNYQFIGFCDTGNFLLSNGNIPIVFMNKKIKIGKFVKYLDCQTVTGKRRIRLYKVDKFQLLINGSYYEKDVYLSYADINYQMMFGLALLGG